jgi:TctA family transporter
MVAQERFGSIFRGQGKLIRQYPMQTLRGSLLGTAVGALPGAGADIAAWISYAISKKLSKTPEKFGTGHVEGVIESGAANNSALSGAWIPALVFGIPGDSITAIAIGVLYLKNMNPGPTIFLENPQNIYAVFIVFFLAQLLMLPLGWFAIKTYKQVLKVPRNVLMPLILLFCMVGAFAINNSVFDIGVMLAFGLLGWFLEANRFPVAPVILGAVLGHMLEDNFINSMIKADGQWGAFFDRPIAGGLAVATFLLWTAPLLLRLWRRARGAAA